MAMFPALRLTRVEDLIPEADNESKHTSSPFVMVRSEDGESRFIKNRHYDPHSGGATRVVPPPEAVDRELIPSLKTLYDKQSEVDLTLLTQDKEVILCHSIVAAVNSPYIQHCLENNIKCDNQLSDSNSTFCVQIADVNRNVIEKQQQKQTQDECLVMRTKSEQIKQYNVNTRKWIELMNVPDWVDGWTSWYASEHRIIIAGAHYNSVNADRVAVLDMKSRGVKELPRLPAARDRPGVVVDGDEVYIIGGFDGSGNVTNTMYYANITQNNGWTTLPTIPTCHSVISVDSDHIYVFGAYPDYTQTQIYNKHTQQWSRGATMPAGCIMFNGRCINDGHKFTIVTDRTMMEYNSNEDTWKIVKRYTPYRRSMSRKSVVSYKGDILSCGIHKKNKISRYDADSDDVWVDTDIDISDIANNKYLFRVYI